jgi:hypothetical protein
MRGIKATYEHGCVNLRRRREVAEGEGQTDSGKPSPAHAGGWKAEGRGESRRIGATGCRSESVEKLMGCFCH